jgi:hypothetical protein
VGGVGAGVGESLAAVVAAEGFVSGMDANMLLRYKKNELGPLYIALSYITNGKQIRLRYSKIKHTVS